jgi:hypothetical protein
MPILLKITPIHFLLKLLKQWRRPLEDAISMHPGKQNVIHRHLLVKYYYKGAVLNLPSLLVL